MKAAYLKKKSYGFHLVIYFLYALSSSIMVHFLYVPNLCPYHNLGTRESSLVI